MIVTWCASMQVPVDAMTDAVDAANVSEFRCTSSSPLHLLRNACKPLANLTTEYVLITCCNSGIPD